MWEVIALLIQSTATTLRRALHHFIFLSAFACLALPSTSAWAEGALITDRPDAAESPQTVGLWRFQVETGVNVSSLRVSGADEVYDHVTVSTPSKLRLGVHDRVEIHVEGGGFVYSSGAGSSTGGADLDFGGKIAILEGGGLIPALGLWIAYTAPIGSDGFSQEHHSVSYLALMGWTLTNFLSLGVNLGLATPLSEREANDDALRYAASFGIGATDELGFFLEQFGVVSFGGDAALWVDGGALYLLNDDWQLDAYLRVGLNDAAGEDIGGGLGFSFRL